MPDFTVIEGGGEKEVPDREATLARQSFKDLVVAILRALARGDDYGRRISTTLDSFLDHAESTDVTLPSLINTSLEELHASSLEVELDGTLSDERKSIVLAALRVAAESMATDGAAKGRLSKRETALLDAVENYVRTREETSRSHGRSYTHRITESLGPWPPPRPKVQRGASRTRAKPKAREKGHTD